MASFSTAFSGKMASFSNRRAGRAPILAALALGTFLTGCSTNLRDYAGSIGGTTMPAASGTALDALARRYDAKPGERRASLDYAAALRANGQVPQAAAVLQRASIANVGDKEIAGAYGKVLADSGRFEEALGVLAQAHTEDRPDWQVLSTMGSINDQLGNHERARTYYMHALQIAPRQPGVLNNLGLSYLLTKELAQAEQTLAEAAAQPGADPRVAANLTLARSLRAQGEKGAGEKAAGRKKEAPRPAAKLAQGAETALRTQTR
jgi:Flp pilus assembly protein TadD